MGQEMVLRGSSKYLLSIKGGGGERKKSHVKVISCKEVKGLRTFDCHLLATFLGKTSVPDFLFEIFVKTSS